jgi:outer membrane receptor for ferrienterochelin and colicin
VHFSYGHFFQLPRFERLYENPKFKFSSLSGNLGLIGNADLNPEETVSAEVGVQQQLSDDIALDITAFMRDIRGLAGTQGEDIETVSKDVYTKFTNSDFGVVKGIVLTLDKKFSSSITARLDYTYQVASGTASDPAQARNAKTSNAGMVPDIQMVPLDWDQRHTLNVSLNYAADIWGLSSILQYGSGKPYTPQYVGASEAATSTTMVRNSQTKPSFFNCDLRAYYELKFDPIKLVLFTRVFNLFDTRNQTDVYGSTGRSDYALEALTASGAFVNSIAQWYQDGNRFSEPRRIEFGMNLEF